MNKRIVLSSVSIFASLALVTGATFAFFSDVGTSNDNIFSGGTLDLKLTDNNETALDNVTASFGDTSLAPGVCLSTQTLEMKNSGTVAGNHIEIAAVNTVTDNAPAATPDMDAYLRFGTFTYFDGTSTVDVAALIPDSNANTFKDLDDLAALGVSGVDNLALIDLNVNHLTNVQVCLDASAPNEVQSDSVDSDWTITLNQDATQ